MKLVSIWRVVALRWWAAELLRWAIRLRRLGLAMRRRGLALKTEADLAFVQSERLMRDAGDDRS